ncbi:hypothetical protein ES703_99225 [subsurface metagenome]
MKIKGQKGASAVEFAIVLPVLVLLLVGTMEFSILLYDQAVITNAGKAPGRESFTPTRIAYRTQRLKLL